MTNDADRNELPAYLQERFEMMGYEWAQSNPNVCYRNVNWTDAEAAAFRKGWEGAK